MKKPSKLTEKPTRIPDMREAQWDEIIPQYLRELTPLNKEAARSHRFAMLLQQLLSIEPNFIENYSTGIEKSIKAKQKDRILKGEVDNLFGNVIMEFEPNVVKKRSEAEGQLQRYVAILWSEESPEARTPYLCIATDGVRFLTYSPTLADGKKKEAASDDVRLHLLEETDWTKLKPHEIFYWLDRYLLRKEILHPTGETIVRDFGIKSHAFQTTNNALLRLWQEIKTESAFKVIYESWERYLRIVYGSDVAGDDLFIRHTYLATLAKLMSWMRIGESKRLPEESRIVKMLEGILFKDQGIENFIEEDFFSWPARDVAVKVSLSVVRWLFSLLQNYNLRELSEDVLKSLYQELVDPETRHDLGEFYTPDWLAHRIVCKLLDINPRGAVLDPACGSGTFLYLAIKEKRERLGNSHATLRHIFNSVYGADIHPLAVIIAKTNYILALGDLMKKRKETITIPVYLADTMRLPKVEKQLNTYIPDAGYPLELNGRTIYLPEALLEDISLYDRAIDLAKEFARQNKGKPIALEPFQNFLQAQRFPKSENIILVKALFCIAKELKYFIDDDRDTIWAFVLKNIFKPLFFKERFDFVVGNPPWISFRYMEPGYQQFLKQQITKEHELLAGRGELITQLEIAALFLVRSADLYLKTGGTIAFVLPKSIFSADQHDGLRQRTFTFSKDLNKSRKAQNLSWLEVWDCEEVAPLFNVPACVLIANKGETQEIKYPISGRLISGRLDRKNASLDEAERALTIKDVDIYLHTRGKRSFWAAGKPVDKKILCYYKTRFFNGATIYPRSFWFVEVKTSWLGINIYMPPLHSSDRARQEAKNNYKDVFFEGNVESPFIYATLLSTDLLPFGHLDYRMIVLPIQPKGNRYRLLDPENARYNGFLYLAQWVEKAEEEWARRRGSKAKRLNVLEWLDYRGKLTAQNPQAKYRVLYNTSGTYLAAAVIEKEPIEFEINGQQIDANGFIADHVTYFYETAIAREAFYLTAILNAPEIDRLIKPMQSRGLWGPRHIHKKVLELPIPQFNKNNSSHIRLSELGKECSEKVKLWLSKGGAGKIRSIGKLRGMVRTILQDELKEIDALVMEILG